MITELIQNRYPKSISLRDKLKVDFRPLKKEDKEILWDFFQAVPDDDRLFLKDDVFHKEVIESWCNNINYESVFPLLAIHEGKIIGDASLHLQQRTWMRHIARIRVVIHPNYRHKGLATALVGELMDLAKKTDLEILDAEFIAEQESAISAFLKLGFKKLAQMEQHVIDIAGKPHDFVIMAFDLK